MSADGFLFIACIAAALFVFYGPWQWVCADFARQIVFEQRDKVFDIAARGDMDFRSHQYKEIRDSLNYLIRFCHELTMPRLLFYHMFMPKSPARREHSTVFEIVHSITEVRLRKEVNEILVRAYAATIIMMLLRSLVAPIAAIVIVIAAVVSVCASGVKAVLARWALTLGDNIQVKADYAMSPIRPYQRN